jgi:histone H3/H4
MPRGRKAQQPEEEKQVEEEEGTQAPAADAEEAAPKKKKAGAKKAGDEGEKKKKRKRKSKDAEWSTYLRRILKIRAGDELAIGAAAMRIMNHLLTDFLNRVIETARSIALDQSRHTLDYKTVSNAIRIVVADPVLLKKMIDAGAKARVTYANYIARGGFTPEEQAAREAAKAAAEAKKKKAEKAPTVEDLKQKKAPAKGRGKKKVAAPVEEGSDEAAEVIAS